MRWIFGTWLAMLAAAAGLATEPGKAALQFVEKVRDGEVNLEPGGDTALTAETTADKREQIARRLERMASDIGDNPLQLGATRVDGDHAAALVRVTSGFDQSLMRVFAIALVKRGDRWLAAPVPASFENTGSQYLRGNRERLAKLQDWMLREQSLDLERLRKELADRMRQEIARALPAAELRNMDSHAAAERLLDACARRDLPVILGLLGGISQSLPEDWALRVKTAQAAVEGESVARPWRLLLAEGMPRVVVRHEAQGREAAVTVGCLGLDAKAPRGAMPPTIEMMLLPFAKTDDGLWRFDPPAEFYQTESEADQEAGVTMDTDLLDAFATKVAELHPPTAMPDARAAAEAILKALVGRDFPAVLRLLPPTKDPVAARESIERAAHIWWALSNPAEPLHAMRPAIGVEGEIAAAVCQFFSPRNPDRPELRVFHFQKSAAGWSWLPAPDEEQEIIVLPWVRELSAEQQESWRERLLADCVRLEHLPDSGLSDDEAAKRVVTQWLEATRNGEIENALKLTARLDTADSAETILRNLGYEITGNRRSEPPPQVIGVHRGGIWAAVGARTVAGDETTFPLYPVIQTPEGPRILLEVDLFAANKRSRDFLNKTALARLDGQPDQAAKDLRDLLRQHEKQVLEPTGEN